MPDGTAKKRRELARAFTSISRPFETFPTAMNQILVLQPLYVARTGVCVSTEEAHDIRTYLAKSFGIAIWVFFIIYFAILLRPIVRSCSLKSTSGLNLCLTFGPYVYVYLNFGVRSRNYPKVHLNQETQPSCIDK